jgi:hypothetical protein
LADAQRPAERRRIIVGHDARHALGGRAVFGRIELGLASRDRSCVLGLQQLRASWIPILSVRS